LHIDYLEVASVECLQVTPHIVGLLTLIEERLHLTLSIGGVIAEQLATASDQLVQISSPDSLNILICGRAQHHAWWCFVDQWVCFWKETDSAASSQIDWLELW